MPRALSKISKKGKAYTRPPEIEASISAALGQDFDVQLRRARIRDSGDRDFMPPECLLHLMREARIVGDTNRVNRLLPYLLSRCEARFKSSIPDGSRADASGIRDELLQTFCELLARVGTNHDSSSLDFFEIRFNRGLTLLRFKRLEKEQTRKRVFHDIGEMKDEEGKPVDEENFLARLSIAARNPAEQENALYLKQVLKFINTLPPAQRAAIILCCIKGYKPACDGEDTGEETAATICGVSGSAIRKSLRKAAEKLKIFSKESSQ